jgi:transposase
MSVVLMSKRELNRLDVLARLNSNRLTVAAAAGLMNVTPRPTYRLLSRYRDGGASANANRRRGRPSNNRLSDEVRDHAIALVKDLYPDFGPTFAAEKLAERHDLRVSRETLRTRMRQSGIWISKAERKRIQQPRYRREHTGELVQIDGSQHRWFEDRADPCTLLVFVDAANAFLPSFIAHYNARFAKPAARDRDFHRELDAHQDVDQILCWRELRQVSHQLVVDYSQMKLMLTPEGLADRLRGKMVEIYDYPDGRLEIRWKGQSLPYSAFDKLQRVSHAAIVDNKRLGEVLAWIKEQQDAQPRFKKLPKGPRRSDQKQGLMKARVLRIQQTATSTPKPVRKRRCRSDTMACAAPSSVPGQPSDDISTLRRPGHLNFVATAGDVHCRKMAAGSHPRRDGGVSV